MDQIQEVKQELDACSTSTSVEELQRRGRKQVKVVKAEHIASLISVAVQNAIAKSGLLPQEEVDRLVAESRDEFRVALNQREQELAVTRETEQELEQTRSVLTETQQQLQSAQQECEQAKTRANELRGALREAESSLAETQAGLEQAQAALEELEAQTAGQAAQQPAAAAPATDNMSAELMFRLMNELAEVKASMAGGSGAVPAPAAATPGAAPAAAAPDMTEAIQQLAGTLNERLEKFGRKMGISSAVEASDVKFDNLFRDDGPNLESNMDQVKVKKRTGGGIAANLEKLKKLKGGG